MVRFICSVYWLQSWSCHPQNVKFLFLETDILPSILFQVLKKNNWNLFDYFSPKSFFDFKISTLNNKLIKKSCLKENQSLWNKSLISLRIKRKTMIPCWNLLRFMCLTLKINFYKIMLVKMRILLVIWLSFTDKHEEIVAYILQV